MIRAKLIVGCHIDDMDPPRPFVVGAIDAGTLDVIDMAEEEALIATAKASYEGMSGEFVWREVWIDVPEEQIVTLFAQPVIEVAVSE